MRTMFPRLARALPLLLLLARPAAAEDPPPPAPPSPAAPLPIEDTMMKGARYFDQAIAWVARGGTLGKTKDFYAQLDATWDLREEQDESHFDGKQSVWFQFPDKLRIELAGTAVSQLKILDGEKAWVVGSDGLTHRQHGTPDGEKTIKQLKEDLLRMSDLTAFLTLEGLKGNGVQFEFLKAVQGSNAYEGKWLKLARHSPDGRKITFWLAYDVDAKGEPHATWPGVVRVEGNAAQNLYTEDWILKDWDSSRAKPRPYRYPSKIQAWKIAPEASKEPSRKFLTAVIDDIQMNVGIEPTRFQPPQPPK